jgi:hypothetical protein
MGRYTSLWSAWQRLKVFGAEWRGSGRSRHRAEAVPSRALGCKYRGYLHFYATEYLKTTRVSDVLHNWALMFAVNEIRSDPERDHMENLRSVNFYCTPAMPLISERRIYKRNPVPEETEAGKIGGIDPLARKFVREPRSFEEIVKRGAPTYVFALPTRLGARDLYVTVLTGEGLQHLFTQENIVELGRLKRNLSSCRPRCPEPARSHRPLFPGSIGICRPTFLFGFSQLLQCPIAGRA